MYDTFEKYSVADLQVLIKMANEANDDSSLFGIDYENDGGSAPRRIRGERLKYKYDPKFIAAMRKEMQIRLGCLYHGWLVEQPKNKTKKK